MATGKSSKRIQEESFDASNWSNLERLILSQAIYEFGADDMDRVAALMSSHAMLSRPKSFFSVKVSSFQALPRSEHILRQ